jgi:hypothetical protein
MLSQMQLQQPLDGRQAHQAEEECLWSVVRMRSWQVSIRRQSLIYKSARPLREVDGPPKSAHDGRLLSAN